MSALPAKLLHNVYWSFSEPVPRTPDELVEALREYAKHIEAPDTSATLLQHLPFTDVCLRYTYAYRSEGGEWCDETEELRVVAPPGTRMTGAALLWELHVACQATVGADDHHYFEGLELLAPPSSGKPTVYEVSLGS
jgi:hypothetical protein